MDLKAALLYPLQEANRKHLLFIPTAIWAVGMLLSFTVLGLLAAAFLLMGYYWALLGQWKTQGLQAAVPEWSDWKSLGFTGMKAFAVLVAYGILSGIIVGIPMGLLSASGDGALMLLSMLLNLVVGVAGQALLVILAFQGAPSLSVRKALQVDTLLPNLQQHYVTFFIRAAIVTVLMLVLSAIWGVSCILIVPILLLPAVFSYLYAVGLYLFADLAPLIKSP
jgi:hypothetical protein